MTKKNPTEKLIGTVEHSTPPDSALHAPGIIISHSPKETVIACRVAFCKDTFKVGHETV